MDKYFTCMYICFHIHTYICKYMPPKIPYLHHLHICIFCAKYLYFYFNIRVINYAFTKSDTIKKRRQVKLNNKKYLNTTNIFYDL